ncbi:MAG: hypothetical protein ACYC1C_21725, partial [Chloroflexota bacterium]
EKRELRDYRWSAGADEGAVSSQGSTPQNVEQPVFADGTDDYAPGKEINPQNYWARFVNLTVNRYKPNGELYKHGLLPADVGVRYWEIWNEPDVPFYWYARGPGSEVGDYLRLLKVAFLAARAADPDTKIVLGGFSYWGREGFIVELLDAIVNDPASGGNRHYFDVLPWHIYSRPIDLDYRAEWTRRLLAERNLGDKEVWINETNIPVWGDLTPPQRDAGTHRGTPEEQASFILQAYAYGLAGGANRIFTFMLYDDCWQWGEHYGLVRNPPGNYEIDDCASDGEPRPGYTAFKVAATYLRDIQSGRLFPLGPDDRAQAASFDKVGGGRVTVVWNKTGEPVTVEVPLGGEALLVDQSGGTTTVTPDEKGVFRLDLPAATANDAYAEEAPNYIVGGRTYMLVEPSAASKSGGLINGGFELSPHFAAWYTGGVEPTSVPLARAGYSSAMLKVAPPESGTSWISQTVIVPEDASPSLNFDYALHTTQPAGDGDSQLSTFEVRVQAAGRQEQVIYVDRRATDWKSVRVELPPGLAGQVVSVKFIVSGRDFPMVAFVDDVTLWYFRVILPLVPNAASVR